MLTLEPLGVKCVTNNFVEERAPTWSPVGTHIVDMCRNPGNNIFEICVMKADGRDQTQLTSNSTLDATPGWSPDGKKIVVARGAAAAAQLWLIDADGTSEAQLVIPPVSPSVNPGANGGPSWGRLWSVAAVANRKK